MSTPAGKRAEKTLSTRRRMVRAAYDLFCSDGYLGTTIAAVAEKAGVAVPTIYYTFGSKAALLDDALGAAVVGFDVWRPPPKDSEPAHVLPWHPWWEEFHSAKSSREAFAICFDNGVQTLSRVAPLVPALHGATGEVDGAEVVRASEAFRIESYREMIRIVASKEGGLKLGVSIGTATDIFVSLFSAELYHSVRVGRGWSHARTSKLLWDLLQAQLLPVDPDATGPVK